MPNYFENIMTISIDKNEEVSLDLHSATSTPMEQAPEPNKQVIILRKDLNMRKGKMVAQGAHASLAVFLQKIVFLSEDDGVLAARFLVSETEHAWLTGNFRKIVLAATSEAELLDLFRKAQDAGLPCSLIKDNGLTEFKGVQTYTAIAIGPAPDVLIDPISGELSPL